MLGVGVPVWAFSPAEFWNAKKPEDWTDEERKQLLAKSPWARDAAVKYNAGPGGLGAPRSGMNRGYGRVGTGRGVANPDATSGPTSAGNYTAVVRWESALPVREANHHLLKDDPAANYILAVDGDLPMLGRHSADESETEFQQRLDMLKQYTKLEKKGDPIFLNKIGYPPGPAATSGTLFYFERNDLITLGDHTVTFVTKLGPIDVKVKFPLKEMMYQGKLEL
jgi:hypothetical protein